MTVEHFSFCHNPDDLHLQQLISVLVVKFLPRDAHSLSVRPSVTLMYREHIGWTRSKLITRIISLVFRFSEPQHQQSSPTETPTKSG